MQPREWRHRIQDIIDAIERIDQHVTGLDQQTFFANAMIIDAVRCNFMIIGEAATHIPEHITQAHSDVPWRKMRQMRNVLIHVYWGVDPAIVWDTICNDLPSLAPILRRILNEATE